MGSLAAILKHSDDVYPLLKLKMAARSAEKQIPSEPHWGFCYSMLHKVSRSFALVIQQLNTDLRNAARLLLRLKATTGKDVPRSIYAQYITKFLSMKLESVNSGINPVVNGFPSKDPEPPTFDATGMMFGSQAGREYAPVMDTEWLHMHLGGGGSSDFERTT